MRRDAALEEHTLAYISRHRLLEAADRVLVAVSGGADSVALLHILSSLRRELGIDQLTVIHFDHQLRGEDSRKDMAFAAELAEGLGLPFHAGCADVLAYHRDRRISLEMAARECRHLFFREALERCGSNRIALAHTASDQAEEVLLRLCRGTGPSGTGGMRPASSAGIVRPLLFAQRREILAYLAAHHLPFREDASNLEPFCQRNALRLEVLPLLERIFHVSLAHALSRHADLVRDEEEWWQLEVDRCWPAVCIEEPPGGIVLGAMALASLHPALQRRLLRRAVERIQEERTPGFYAVHVESLRRLVVGGSGSRSLRLPAGLSATIEGGRLTLARRAPVPPCPSGSGIRVTIEGPGLFRLPSCSLEVDLCHRVELEPFVPPQSRDVAWLDAASLAWPLTVRTWEPGDRFSPLGHRGSRKLQDFFTDLKIPRPQRRLVPLVCDREKICWVVGLRIDDRVKVGDGTQRVVVLRRSPGGGEKAPAGAASSEAPCTSTPP